MSTTLIGKRLGNYDIQSQIGEGGMGIVYLGVHPQIGKKVAIKVLHEELSSKADVVTRFFNEAKAVNDISHPNIVDIIDFGETTYDSVPVKYIIMEFLDGESLAARIKREGVTIRETLGIVGQCASALFASHQKGVVHRDLKPENVFLCNRPGDRNYVKLLDFGIAKLTSDNGQGLSQKTRTGMVIGTPTYMSPEQCDGRGDIDHRADIYALGVMMYELLTGRVPFPGDGFGEVLVAHLTRDPEPPRQFNANIPPDIEAIVLRCMKKKKTDRFQSMNDMLGALNDPATHYQTFINGQPAPIAAPNQPVFGTVQSASMVMNASQLAMAAGLMPAGMPMQGVQQVQPPAWAVGNGLPGMGAPPSQALPVVQQPMTPMSSGGVPMAQQAAQALASSRPPSGMNPVQAMPMGYSGPNPAASQPGVAAEMVSASSRPVNMPSSATPRPRRKPMSVMLGFVGAMALGSLSVVGYKAATGRSTAAQPPTPATVSVVVKTTPADAEVLRSDQLDGIAGHTPLTLSVKKGSKIDVKIRLAGYKEESRSLDSGKDGVVELSLLKDKEEVATKPETPTEPVAEPGTTSKPKKGKDPVAAKEPAEKPAKEPAEKPAKPAEKPAKPAKEPAEKPAKPAKEPAEKPAKPAKEPTEKPAKPAKEPVEKPGKKPKKSRGDGDGIIRPIF